MCVPQPKQTPEFDLKVEPEQIIETSRPSTGATSQLEKIPEPMKAAQPEKAPQVDKATLDLKAKVEAAKQEQKMKEEAAKQEQKMKVEAQK